MDMQTTALNKNPKPTLCNHKQPLKTN